MHDLAQIVSQFLCIVFVYVHTHFVHSQDENCTLYAITLTEKDSIYTQMTYLRTLGNSMLDSTLKRSFL